MFSIFIPRRSRGMLYILLCCFVPVFCTAAVKLPPKDKFYLVMLAGQSNMAGRGTVLPEDKIAPPRVLKMNRSGEWEPAAAPVHFDVSWVGIGPGETFGRLLAESDPDITVGLIPTACGGSSIRHWQPGAYWKRTDSHPYDDAVARTEKALQAGTLKAILWHQGESDCSNAGAASYETELKKLLTGFRSRFKAEDVPLIIGQLPRFYHAPWKNAEKKVDMAHQKIAAELPNAVFVSSEGMTSNPDRIHFNRESQQEMGRRYFAAYLKLSGDKKAAQ